MTKLLITLATIFVASSAYAQATMECTTDSRGNLVCWEKGPALCVKGITC